MRRTVLFVEGTKGFISQAIVNRLKQTGFTIRRVPDDLDKIAFHRNESQMMIYYPSGGNYQIEQITRYLLDLVEKERKSLCIIGNPDDISIVNKMDNSDKIAHMYERPFDLDILIEDMEELADSHQEYKWKKNILIADDDPDFLKVMEGWLKNLYRIDCVRSGSEVLHFLKTARPDLILLDYEMPDLDGYQVMNEIRKNPFVSKIPIIFLTGKNDKEVVMRILERKPEGYLLKSTSKDEVLDTLDQFFANSILRNK